MQTGLYLKLTGTFYPWQILMDTNFRTRMRIIECGVRQDSLILAGTMLNLENLQELGLTQTAILAINGVLEVPLTIPACLTIRRGPLLRAGDCQHAGLADPAQGQHQVLQQRAQPRPDDPPPLGLHCAPVPSQHCSAEKGGHGGPARYLQRVWNELQGKVQLCL